MKNDLAKTMLFHNNVVPIEGTQIGRIVGIDGNGSVFVHFPGNLVGPIVARSTTSANLEMIRKGNSIGKEVLLVFENNEPTRPIIVDTMHSVADGVVAEPATTVMESETPPYCTVDGNRIAINAGDEISLTCGKASITLTKAGKILIKGEYVLSHASGENRMKGGSISIN